MNGRQDEPYGESPTMTIGCPCGAEIPVELNPSLEWEEDDERQRIAIDPDLLDLWAHYFTHEVGP